MQLTEQRRARRTSLVDFERYAPAPRALRRHGVTALCGVLAGLAVATSANAQPSSPPTATQVVRAELIAGRVQGASHGDLKRYRAALLHVYPDSGLRLLWHSGPKRTVQADSMLAELADASVRGLRDADYDGSALRFVLGVADRDHVVTDAERLRADLWLTLSTMRFMDHLHRGRVDPRPLGFALPGTRRVLDLDSLVVAVSRATNVRAQLDSLEPPFVHYRGLKAALAKYRLLAADSTLTRLPSLHARAYLTPGSAGVAPLTRLLTALGDLPVATTTSMPVAGDSVAPGLVDAVKHFQSRHGLAADGVVGVATLRALLTPIPIRVEQIVLTMERWRWLPDTTAARLIIVNIPAFRLYAFDRTLQTAVERPVERMDVIVGNAYRRKRTPVFSGAMRDVIFQPFWDVPTSIARREEVPKMRRDAAYAAREGLEIVRGDDADAKIEPVTDATLARVASGALRLRQRPGARNSLGPVKFIFPNDYDVYLHGTPAQSLFAQSARDFSHGCIRVSDPARLAAFVLAGIAKWDSTHIAEAMQPSAPMQRVELTRPLPVFSLYGTAVADDGGGTTGSPRRRGGGGGTSSASLGVSRRL